MDWSQHSRHALTALHVQLTRDGVLQLPLDVTFADEIVRIQASYLYLVNVAMFCTPLYLIEELGPEESVMLEVMSALSSLINASVSAATAAGAKETPSASPLPATEDVQTVSSSSASLPHSSTPTDPSVAAGKEGEGDEKGEGVVLITQYFQSREPSQQSDIDFALANNLANPLIRRIVLLTETPLVYPGTPLYSTPLHNALLPVDQRVYLIDITHRVIA